MSRLVDLDLCMRAVGKSGRVLFAFEQFYLRFYGLTSEVMLRNFSVFGCISTMIYCLDNSLEEKSSNGTTMNDLERLVSARMIIDTQVEAILAEAAEYCVLESAKLDGRRMTLPEVHRLTDIRSVDFRLMHLALLQIAKIPAKPEIMAWFRRFEKLMEIEDDLQSIKQDRRVGGYNFFLCLSELLGVAGASRLTEETRSSLENGLHSGPFSASEFPASKAVFTAYRNIVPRPVIE